MGSEMCIRDRDRYVTIGDYEYDRLLSKWAIYKEGASKDEIVSHARYASVDKIHVKQSVEAIPLKSKKGLGGFKPWIPCI